MYNNSDLHQVGLPHSNATRPTIIESFCHLFYLILPKESRFEDVAHVPDYTTAASPAFFALIFLEFVIAKIKHKRTLRVNDGITSVNAGINSRLIRLWATKSVEMSLYCYVYDNWRIVDLPWDSNVTWILSFFGMDFAYYWFHRAAHEINFLWASHQTHHSSEDYNLTTALRQSALQAYGSMFFYAPCAFLIPPSVHLVHLQINILFQFWIHTELIDSIGPLEYILNTPSHHRVHHGRNPYCIDKNYAGTLIIWDRMFGTFAPERRDEKLAYGLVAPVNTFDTFYVQLAYGKNILVNAWNIEGISNKLSTLLKGPGWMPGKPRLGCTSDLPEIESPIVRYDGNSSKWVSVYAIMHSIALVPIYDQLMALRLILTGSIIIFDVLFILSALTCMGFLFDKKRYAYHLECMRCIVSALVLQVTKNKMSLSHQLPVSALNAIEVFYLLSTVTWLLVLSSNYRKQKTV